MAQKLYIGQVPNAAASLFAVTATTQLVSATVTNTGATAATLSLWIVESGGSAGDANAILQDFSIDAGATVGLPTIVAGCMKAQDALHGVSDTASALTLWISG